MFVPRLRSLHAHPDPFATNLQFPATNLQRICNEFTITVPLLAASASAVEHVAMFETNRGD